MKEKSHLDKGNPNRTHRQHCNSLAAQRTRMLKWFRNESKLTTFMLRKRGVMHPAGRVMELRKQGFRIDLHWVYEPDLDGVVHRLGQYVFQGHKDMEV